MARTGVEASPYRVEHDVAADGVQIGLPVDQLGVEAAFQHVPRPPVLTIEPLAADAVELPHGARELGVGGLQQQVIMIAHQTVGMAEGMVALHDGGEDRQETLAVGVVGDDRLAPVASGRDVIEPA